jgi:hypothetical protein
MRQCLWIIPLVLLAIQAAPADAVYTYTGNDFTNFNGLTCPSDCSIDGSFTVASPLGNNFSGLVTPISFDFYISTAGTPTWSNTNGATATFKIFTDGSGAIEYWFVDINSGIYPLFESCHPDPPELDFTCGGNGAEDAYIGSANTSAAITNDPGSWIETSPTTPEIDPASGSSVLTLLAGVVLIFRGRTKMTRPDSGS